MVIVRRKSQKKTFLLSVSESRTCTGSVEVIAKDEDEARDKFYDGDYVSEINWGSEDYINDSLEIDEIEEV